jgi:hypothetical protein
MASKLSDETLAAYDITREEYNEMLVVYRKINTMYMFERGNVKRSQYKCEFCKCAVVNVKLHEASKKHKLLSGQIE